MRINLQAEAEVEVSNESELSTAREFSSGIRSSDDMEILWKEYAEDGEGSEAEARIVELHLGLVDAVVGRIAVTLPVHVDSDDLRSAGLVGLLNATRRFNANSGASFATYARLRIRGAILDELRRLDWVPRSIHEKARKIQDVMQTLEQQLGAAPSEFEMARALNVSVNEYRSQLAEVQPASFVCLDSVRSVEGDDSVCQGEVLADDDVVAPDRATATREHARLLADRIEMLPETQRKVLALYYYEDLTLREIAEVFGVSESRICQIHGQAILALKSSFVRDDSWKSENDGSIGGNRCKIEQQSRRANVVAPRTTGSRSKSVSVPSLGARSSSLDLI